MSAATKVPALDAVLIFRIALAVAHNIFALNVLITVGLCSKKVAVKFAKILFLIALIVIIRPTARNVEITIISQVTKTTVLVALVLCLAARAAQIHIVVGSVL